MTTNTTTKETLGIKSTIFHSNESWWFVRYDHNDNTTSLVVCGYAAGGALILTLKGDHLDEFRKIVDKVKGESDGVSGALGECIVYACSNKDIVPSRCTLGGAFSSKLKIS